MLASYNVLLSHFTARALEFKRPRRYPSSLPVVHVRRLPKLLNLTIYNNVFDS